MNFSNPNIRYRVSPGQTEPDDMHSYRVEEWDGSDLLRSFLVVITESQRLTHAPAESAIEKWCEGHSDKLTADGNKITIDLNEMRIL
jgi:hypothetical protein